MILAAKIGKFNYFEKKMSNCFEICKNCIYIAKNFKTIICCINHIKSIS